MAAHLMHSIGASNAALMLMTGDPITAEKALAWGLISEVVPQTELLARARAIADAIAARAPIAAETAKANLKAAVSMPAASSRSCASAALPGRTRGTKPACRDYAGAGFK